MIAIVCTARPSYAKLYTVIEALQARGVPLHLVVCASALLARYGQVVNVMRADWSALPMTEVWSTYEGATIHTSAKETAALLAELSGIVARLQPSACVVVADRHEVLAAAQAVAYQHVPLVHLQGGEVSGSIDNKVRDAMTALADYHCVSTTQARSRVYALTGAWETNCRTGCPSLDLAARALHDLPVKSGEIPGVGSRFHLDRDEPFGICLFHPVTDEPDAGGQMHTVLEALHRPGVPRMLLFWPGEDAGADAIAKVLRTQAEGHHLVRTLPPQRFLRLVSQAAVLVGNSSAGIREASFLGTPVVNIGRRQHGRERGPNVIDVPVAAEAIHGAIVRQVAHGPYPSSSLYGAGDAGLRVADALQAWGLT